MDATLALIEKYNLKEEFNYLLSANRGNMNPYHNLRHTLSMINRCYKGAIHESLEKDKIRNLLVAAIFHDFNHSAGLSDDKTNVRRAVVEFQTFAHSKYDRYDINQIQDIICATEYPYVIPAEELNLQQQIIRDADILQVFEEDWISQVFFGLHLEFRGTLSQTAVGMKKFFEEVKFNTEWATLEMAKNGGEYYMSLSYLSSIL